MSNVGKVQIKLIDRANRDFVISALFIYF